MQRAGIEDAVAVVAATNDDAQDALAILTAQTLNPEVNIVAAATDRENIEKLRRAGADTVISPAVRVATSSSSRRWAGRGWKISPTTCSM